MAILQVTADHDYRLDALSNITGMDFAGPYVAIFDQSQFGGAGISNSLSITSGSFQETSPVIVVNLTAGGSGFTTVPWDVNSGGGVTVRLIGGAGSETMTGSSKADHEFVGGGGADVLTGGDNRDIFVYAASGDIEAGEKIDGGGLWEGEGDDTISVRASADFRGAGITDIEWIEILGAGTVATFFDDQLRVPGADFVDEETMNIRAEKAGGTAQTLVVHADPTGLPAPSDPDGYASLRYVSFWNWGPEDLIFINGTEADDFLFGSNYADIFAGGAGKDELVGRQGADTIDGGDGPDKLVGGAGKDVLTGGTGNDAFVFAAPLKKGANLDRIADFEHGADVLRLDREEFAGLKKGKVAKDAFHSGGKAVKAKDGEDRIIYNETTGALYHDKDGKGGAKAIQFAALDGAPELKAGDIVVFG